MNRNINAEVAFLNAAGDRDFAAAVMARLHKGQHDYGNRWSERTLHELLAEVVEETIDVAAWSALTSQLDMSELSDANGDRIVACLDELAHLAGKAYAVTTTALSIVHRYAVPDTTEIAA